MRTVFAGLFMLSCCMGTAMAQQVVRSYRADVALDIDTQGQVAHATLPDDLAPMFDAPIQEAVSRWRFKPVMKDGIAVTARTYARIKLDVLQQAQDKFGVRVICLSNGPSLTFMQAPKFPADMMRTRTEGTVQMEAIVQPDGSVTDIRATDAKISGGRIGGPEHSKDAFRRAALAAMQHMQAKPEWIDGKPIATAISLPLAFGLNSAASGSGASGSAVGSASGTGN